MRARISAMLFVAAAVLALTGGCALPADEGMTRMKPDAMAYEQAKAACFERTMGLPMGGPGESSAHDRAYRACLSEMGWQDMRKLF